MLPSLAILLAFLVASAGSSDGVALPPTAVGSVYGGSSSDTAFQANRTWHGVVEFDLRGVPSASIQGATLSITFDSFVYNSNTHPENWLLVPLGLEYDEGDGVITPDDWSPIGHSNTWQSGGVKPFAAFDVGWPVILDVRDQVTNAINQGWDYISFTVHVLTDGQVVEFGIDSGTGVWIYQEFEDNLSLTIIPQDAAIHQARSMQTHGVAGDFGPLIQDWAPTVAVEPRSGGVSELHVTFDRIMDELTTTDPANVAIVGATFGPYQGTVALSIDCSNILIIGLSPPLEDTDCYTVDLTGMTGCDGTALVNPAFNVTTLAGDVNGSGVVNATDKNVVKGKIGTPLSADDFLFDVNLSGRINATDKNLVKGWIGHTVAECP